MIALYGVASSRLLAYWRGSGAERYSAPTPGHAVGNQGGFSPPGQVFWGRRKQGTHIRVPPDLLEGLVIKVAGVADEATDDVVCVLETLEDVGGDGELGALAELHALILSLGVDALHPLVVLLGVLDVLLQNDNVGVGDNLLGGGGRQHGGSVVVDGADLEGRSCGQRQQGEG